ncbi:MAG: hypothetical protein L0Y68_07755 [Candidatus Dadabacteria bacterium]|nr:hypothetical protein [Candidatus Dadabacteria bacterium]
MKEYAVELPKEAGGKVTEFKGRDWKLNKSDLILSNSKINKELVVKLKEALQGSGFYI